MAHKDDIGLMAHLMRRAGFGAGRDELEAHRQGLRRHRRGIAAPRDATAGRPLYLASLPAIGAAARRGAADGQRQLHVLPGDHEAAAGRADGAVLMIHIIEDLSVDWRRLDERIETVTSEIEALSREDHEPDV